MLSPQRRQHIGLGAERVRGFDGIRVRAHAFQGHGAIVDCREVDLGEASLSGERAVVDVLLAPLAHHQSVLVHAVRRAVRGRSALRRHVALDESVLVAYRRGDGAMGARDGGAREGQTRDRARRVGPDGLVHGAEVLLVHLLRVGLRQPDVEGEVRLVRLALLRGGHLLRGEGLDRGGRALLGGFDLRAGREVRSLARCLGGLDLGVGLELGLLADRLPRFFELALDGLVPGCLLVGALGLRGREFRLALLHVRNLPRRRLLVLGLAPLELGLALLNLGLAPRALVLEGRGVLRGDVGDAVVEFVGRDEVAVRTARRGPGPRVARGVVEEHEQAPLVEAPRRREVAREAPRAQVRGAAEGAHGPDRVVDEEVVRLARGDPVQVVRVRE